MKCCRSVWLMGRIELLEELKQYSEVNYHRPCRWLFKRRQLLTLSFAVVSPDFELILSDLAFDLFFYIFSYDISVDTDRADEIASIPYMHTQYLFANSGNSFRNRWALFPFKTFITWEGAYLGGTDTYICM